jgi:phosphoribosylglycinamide formyltransferase-1
VIHSELTSEQLLTLVHDHAIDAVVLAGYLKKIPVPPELEGRIVNIHPALLPRFGGPGMYGDRVHQAVLDASRTEGITESGCTVHLCNEQYDEGDILLQLRCPIRSDDTPQTLAARVFELEQVAYPTALRVLLDRLREESREGT